MLKGTKLNHGYVIYVIKQFIFKVDQNVSLLNIINTKKNMVSLLKNMNFLNHKMMK